MKMVEGNKTESEVIKYKGKAIGHDCTYEGTGRAALHEYLFLPRRGFKSGRTIELRRFEFCRISIGLDVSVPEGLTKEEVYEACMEFCLEHLQAEEVAVGQGNYDPKISERTFEVLGMCEARMVSLHYGLTLKAAKEFESHQVDVLNWEPVSDGEDMEEFFQKLSDEMAEKLDAQDKRIKSIGETGL
jgi:hypothetical protein